MRLSHHQSGFVHRPVHVRVRIGGIARALTTFIEDDVAPDAAAAEVKRMIDWSGMVPGQGQPADVDD